MVLQFREYRGRKMIYLDCRGLDDHDLIHILEEAAEVMRPMNEKVPVLANVTDVALSSEFMEKMKSLTRDVFVDKVENTAIVGVDGLKNVLLKTYNFLLNRDLRTFPAEEEALEWLYQGNSRMKKEE
ncbi:hypothetical protein JXO52_06830 [bacterium]|nr:hypothetical protein [bacterium]